MHTLRVLLVVTSADRVAGLPDPTGSWLEEVAAPYYTFKDAHCDVTLASPQGGAAPIDARSLDAENQTAATRRFAEDLLASNALKATQKLAGLNLAQFDGVFFAGGHGTMEDFPTDATVKGVVEQFYADGKPVAAVCHGPACFVRATKPNGEALMHGHRFTCFSDAEETAIGLEKLVPFLLESRLREQGGTPDVAPLFVSNVIVSANVITGQNPASAIPTAEAVIHQMRARRSAKEAA